MTSSPTFTRAMSVQTTGNRIVQILFRCSECASLVDSDGQERHYMWHRGQAGELSPPVIEQRVGDLVRAAWRLRDAYDNAEISGSAYTADVIDAADAFSPDEVEP